jgi:hypothetical protein
VSARILAIGVDAEHGAVDRAAFDAETSFGNYAVVFVDPRAATGLWQDLRGRGRSSSDSQIGRTLLGLIQRRRREVAELLAEGGTVVTILRPVGTPLRVRQRRTSGASTTVLHAYSWLPTEAGVSELVIAAGEGSKVSAADAQHFAWQLLEAQGERCRFEAYVGNDQLASQWHVIATDRLGHPVAFESAVGRGRLVFIPPIAARSPEERGQLIADILAPPPEVGGAEPPPWLDDCLLPGQKDLRERIPGLQSEIQRLQAELEEATERHEELSRLNRLLYAPRGAELLAAAKTAFRHLGFEVSPVPNAGDAIDLRSEDGAARVVLAAAEGAIDSDPYWRSTELMDSPDAPEKGIILGNAHCTAPPEQRGKAFTDLLRRGAHHKNLALVNAADLYDALSQLIAEPDDDLRRRLRQTLLGTDGVCSTRAGLDDTSEAD